LTNDAWNFVAVARIGSDIKIWINGTEVNVTANTAVQPGSVENAGNLYKMRFNFLQSTSLTVRMARWQKRRSE